MRHIHFGSQITHLEQSTKTNPPLNRTLVIINMFISIERRCYLILEMRIYRIIMKFISRV